MFFIISAYILPFSPVPPAVFATCLPTTAKRAFCLLFYWLYIEVFIYLNKYALPRFLKIAYDVLNIKKTNDIEKDALKGIECLDDYFYKLGMPLSMEDLNIPYEKLEEFALSLSLNKTRIIPDIIPIDYERGKMIFSKMWKNKGEENVN